MQCNSKVGLMLVILYDTKEADNFMTNLRKVRYKCEHNSMCLRGGSSFYKGMNHLDPFQFMLKVPII